MPFDESRLERRAGTPESDAATSEASFKTAATVADEAAEAAAGQQPTPPPEQRQQPEPLASATPAMPPFLSPAAPPQGELPLVIRPRPVRAGTRRRPPTAAVIEAPPPAEPLPQPTPQPAPQPAVEALGADRGGSAPSSAPSSRAGSAPPLRRAAREPPPAEAAELAGWLGALTRPRGALNGSQPGRRPTPTPPAADAAPAESLAPGTGVGAHAAGPHRAAELQRLFSAGGSSAGGARRGPHHRAVVADGNGNDASSAVSSEPAPAGSVPARPAQPASPARSRGGACSEDSVPWSPQDDAAEPAAPAARVLEAGHPDALLAEVRGVQRRHIEATGRCSLDEPPAALLSPGGGDASSASGSCSRVDHLASHQSSVGPHLPDSFRLAEGEARAAATVYALGLRLSRPRRPSRRRVPGTHGNWEATTLTHIFRALRLPRPAQTELLRLAIGAADGAHADGRTSQPAHWASQLRSPAERWAAAWLPARSLLLHGGFDAYGASLIRDAAAELDVSWRDVLAAADELLESSLESPTRGGGSDSGMRIVRFRLLGELASVPELPFGGGGGGSGGGSGGGGSEVSLRHACGRRSAWLAPRCNGEEAPAKPPLPPPPSPSRRHCAAPRCVRAPIGL